MKVRSTIAAETIEEKLRARAHVSHNIKIFMLKWLTLNKREDRKQMLLSQVNWMMTLYIVVRKWTYMFSKSNTMSPIYWVDSVVLPVYIITFILLIQYCCYKIIQIFCWICYIYFILYAYTKILSTRWILSFRRFDIN